MNHTYLILIDADGHRITSLLLGIHGKTMNELKEVAKQYNPTTMLEASEEDQQQFLNGKVYINGQFVEPPPYVPSLEEAKEQAKARVIASYKDAIDKYKEEMLALTLANASIDRVQEAFKTLKEEEIAKLNEIEGAKKIEDLRW